MKTNETKVYCNPLPLENYPRGRGCKRPGYTGKDFREMADPTVIRFDGKWYLFPSAGMLWHSDDMVNWTHRPIEPFDPGYAPTVAVKGDWLYLSASWDGSAVWRARHPFGPWERMGEPGHDADGNKTWLKDYEGNPVRWGDPCLFVDDDGAMYCYCNLARRTSPEENHRWKLTPHHGIHVVRLRDDDPSSFAEKPQLAISPDPSRQWERFGEFNQRVEEPVIEGAWMNKINGRYYLQYSSNGTEYRNYAVACFVSDNPLGPFTPQERNPILIHKEGLINGCAHHSIVEGPHGTLWCFYTTLVRINAPYERRIGMDPAGIDENGELFIAGPSETPQLAPGIVEKPQDGNGMGLVPLSVNCPVSASSHVEGHYPMYAVDNYIRTWWQAGNDNLPQWIEVDLEGEYTVHSARIMFADSGLDYKSGIVPGPYAYRILTSLDGCKWEVLLDKSDNKIDRHIAFDAWEARRAKLLRLEILSVPRGMKAAVWEFTVFGSPQWPVSQAYIRNTR